MRVKSKFAGSAVNPTASVSGPEPTVAVDPAEQAETTSRSASAAEIRTFILTPSQYAGPTSSLGLHHTG
ncbi:hypothetical protein GCM10022380_23700 [Amycolatopsis tucumanensis]|uniref:Uncharacterized protein n=1 Tax=Amycolatopsis tucumanensis TaxID=401106 RepID=A0ABP7I3L1_9PSEU